MLKERVMRFRMATIAVALGLALSSTGAAAQPNAVPTVSTDADDIEGLVSGPNGPEAGVWVIAETTDLPTKYAKIVVTDDAGRYLLPELPQATYSIWVRGYGLVDSPKVQGAPGRTLDLRAVAAPDAKAAAQYYPAIYWYSMLRIPGADQFGGKSDIPETLTQVDWLTQVKNIGCIGCHQLGQASTRTIPSVFLESRTHEEAWMRRVQSGQSGEQMTNQLAGAFGGVPFKYYAEWTERIARGETPHAHPKRPEGLERNIVVTSWEWHTEKQYLGNPSAGADHLAWSQRAELGRSQHPIEACPCRDLAPRDVGSVRARELVRWAVGWHSDEQASHPSSLCASVGVGTRSRAPDGCRDLVQDPRYA